MSVFFAMTGQGEARRPAFFLTRKAAPAGAVEITDARHRALLEGQSEGRAIIVDARGRPAVDRRSQPKAADVRAVLAARLRREAARRIRAISPEWQQLNDLRDPSEAGAIRFARIDAVRAASNMIEQLATGLPVEDLAALPIANNPHWPEFD